MIRPIQNSVNIGNAGEHFVMAQLLEQGFQAFMADRGNPAFDISVVDGSRFSLLRVKTTKADSVVWSRKKDGKTFLELREVGDFCCVVDFRLGFREAITYVVPTKIVQESIEGGRRDWLSRPRRDGTPRADSSGQRLWLDEKTDTHAYHGYAKKWEQYRGNWDQLRDGVKYV